MNIFTENRIRIGLREVFNKTITDDELVWLNKMRQNHMEEMVIISQDMQSELEQIAEQVSFREGH